MRHAALRIVLSPWMILVFLAVAWCPLFMADLVRVMRPDLDASYTTQAFAMGWMGITMICSLLAIVLSVVHLVRFFLRLFSRDGNGGLDL